MGNAIKKFLGIFADASFVGQYSHFAWAYGVVYTFYSVKVAVGFFVAAAVKEFYIDKHFEYRQTAKQNAIDLGSYTLGIAVAIIARHFLAH